MNDYRHVCFKDLDNYWRKDDYFDNLSDSAKTQIKKNLGLDLFESKIIEADYETIKELADTNQLNLGNTYIVNDFQTIYLSNTNEVFGLDNVPSKVYSIILTPISENQFSKDVLVLENNIAKSWIVRYDFRQEVINGIKTKGKITYLQDQNNNVAYYDFKNIRTSMQLENSDYNSLLQSGNYLLYTFNKFENGEFVDSSDDSNIVNNIFEQNCYGNAFLSETQNNHFCGGFKNNLFTSVCKNNKFEWDTYNNKFVCNILNSHGTLNNALVTDVNLIFDSSISKEFRMLQKIDNTIKPVIVAIYFDGETLTNQIVELNTR